MLDYFKQKSIESEFFNDFIELDISDEKTEPELDERYNWEARKEAAANLGQDEPDLQKTLILVSG